MQLLFVYPLIHLGGLWNEQVFNDGIEALRVSYKKMNPFCVPFATTNMGSAMLAMDLVSLKLVSSMLRYTLMTVEIWTLSFKLMISSGMDGP